MSASGDLLVQRLEQLYERKLIPWEAYKKAVGHAKDAGELMDQNDTDAYFDLLRLRDSLRWLTDRDPEIMAFYEYVIQLSERYKL